MPDTPCPTDDTFRELLEGTLDPLAASTLDEHVTACPECERRLAGIQPSAAGFVVWQGMLDAPPDGGLTRVVELTPETPTGIRRFGKYQIEGELGRGGMGVVYRALDTRLQRPVALKVMLQSVTASAAARERFVQEARSAAAIRSEHVVTTFEADEIAGTSYIAFELLQGRSLAVVLAADPRPPLAEVVRVLSHVARGLDAAHRLGFVHRDIKPSNLWVCEPDGPVKVLDFGLTRPPRSADGLTGAGVVLGTPGYLAPEQARGEPTDARADLFSLGVTAYQMLTGRMPFPGETAAAMLMALAHANPAPVHDHRPDCPPALATLVHAILSNDPAGRPATAAEVADRLDVMSRRLDLMRPIPHRSRRWKWPAVGVAAAVILAVLVFVLMTQRPNPTLPTDPTTTEGTPPAAVPAAEARYILDADDNALTAWAAGLPKGFRITRLSRRTGTAERRYEAVAHIDPAGMPWKLMPYRTFEEEKLAGKGGLEPAGLAVDVGGGRRLVANPRAGLWFLGTGRDGMARFAEDMRAEGAAPTSFSGVGADYFDIHAESDPEGREWSLVYRHGDFALASYLAALKQVKQSRVMLAAGHVEAGFLSYDLVVGTLLPGEAWEYRTGVTADELRHADDEFRKRGYRLDTLTSKATAEGPRYNGTWLLEPPAAELTAAGAAAMTRLHARGYAFTYLRDGVRVSTSPNPTPFTPGPIEVQFVQFPWQTPATDADLADLARLPPTRGLVMFHQTDPPGGVGALVARSPFASARFVSWSGGRLTVPLADALAAMPRLTVLGLVGAELTTAELSRLSACRLRALHLSRTTGLTPAAAPALAKFPWLTDLSLDGTVIGEESLPDLAFLRQLARLKFGGTRSPITDRTAAVAGASWPLLVSLTLHNARLTVDGAPSLAKCPRLHTLALMAGSVARADLLTGLCKLSTIRTLSLDGARPLENDAWAVLAKFKQLETLTLPKGTPETERKKLEDALPKCKVLIGKMASE